jgi:hypothetical protein
MLVPHNFHDRDPSRESAQGVKLTLKTPDGGRGSDVKYYGGKYTKNAVVDLVLLDAPHLYKRLRLTLTSSTNFNLISAHITHKVI